MPRHVVVDGSNIATEGRSLPSLAQLDEGVRAFLEENPEDVLTVVVDASFGHRIEPSEVKLFDEAEAAGEVISPPAGAIGRGDAFLLRIAEKTGATVLSNDSFQEFHGEHEWLFTEGRLIGGKPVPAVGWIFTPRTPVRGPKSREAVKQAKHKQKAVAVAPDSPMPGLDLAAERAKGKGRGKKKVAQAIAVATEEAVEPGSSKRRRRRRGGAPPSEPLNEPLVFIQFVAAHPLGSEVSASVDSFSSHGAFVMADGVRCYVPLSAMGDPPPRSAREVMAKGEERAFVVQALDPPRRGVELALPQFAQIAGGPTAETVEAEIAATAELEALPAAGAPAPARRSAKKRVRGTPAEGAKQAPAKQAPAKQAPVKQAPGKKAPVKKAVVKKAVVKKAVAQKAPAQKAPAGKTASQKAPARKAPARKAPARKAPARKAPAQKAAAEMAPAKKAPARKAMAAKAGAEKAPANKASTRKAPAKKAAPPA
jgi:hypothetical protein